MNVQNSILQLWSQSRKTKITPSGWVSGNAVCCNDTRGRGGMRLFENGSLAYHCFNCGTRVVYHSGSFITKKVRALLTWMGVSDSIIHELSMQAISEHSTESTNHALNTAIPTFKTTRLQKNAVLLNSIKEPIPELIPVLNFLSSRKIFLNDYPFYWNPRNPDRLIIPFYYHGKLVGSTKRLINSESTLRYIMDRQPGYVFNLDNQTDSKHFVLVCEGTLDAILLGGVALLGSELNPIQATLINQLKKPVIYIPDRDEKGMTVIDKVLEYKWAVSFPDWDNGIKDINDSVIRYGRLSTLARIKTGTIHNYTKIQVMKEFWFKK